MAVSPDGAASRKLGGEIGSRNLIHPRRPRSPKDLKFHDRLRGAIQARPPFAKLEALTACRPECYRGLPWRDGMRRREFIAGFGGAVAWPMVARPLVLAEAARALAEAARALAEAERKK
jgi:hypothetical protein